VYVFAVCTEKRLPCPLFLRLELRYIPATPNARFASAHPDYCVHFSHRSSLSGSSNGESFSSPSSFQDHCSCVDVIDGDVFGSLKHVHDHCGREVPAGQRPFSSSYLSPRDGTRLGSVVSEDSSCIERVVLRVVCLTLPTLGIKSADLNSSTIPELPTTLSSRVVSQIRRFLDELRAVCATSVLRLMRYLGSMTTVSVTYDGL
jgi:hypothetical protein